MDSNGLSDPYLKFMYGKTEKQTSVIKKTLNPEWNETYKLPGNYPTIKFVAMDKDVGKDDKMGVFVVNLNEIPKMNKEFTITKNLTGKKAKGAITLQVIKCDSEF